MTHQSIGNTKIISLEKVRNFYSNNTKSYYSVIVVFLYFSHFSSNTILVTHQSKDNSKITSFEKVRKFYSNNTKSYCSICSIFDFFLIRYTYCNRGSIRNGKQLVWDGIEHYTVTPAKVTIVLLQYFCILYRLIGKNVYIE